MIGVNMKTIRKSEIYSIYYEDVYFEVLAGFMTRARTIVGQDTVVDGWVVGRLRNGIIVWESKEYWTRKEAKKRLIEIALD